VSDPSGDPAPRRMALTGLHHVTLICRDLDVTTAFYRDLLGLALVSKATNDDDPDARHFWFGDAAGRPGTLVSFLEYPMLPRGTVGTGSTHHLAFAVESAEEQKAWRNYLHSHGVECTDVLNRGQFRSLYLRDPDGHIIEIAAPPPATVGEHDETGGQIIDIALPPATVAERDGICPQTGKVCFADEYDAQQEVERNQAVYDQGLEDRFRLERTYPCKFCGWWHTTSQSKRG